MSRNEETMKRLYTLYVLLSWEGHGGIGKALRNGDKCTGYRDMSDSWAKRADVVKC